MNIWTVDAFTDEPFAGNPAAVVVLNRFPEEKLLQNIAAEMNLSETAFLVQLDQNYFHIRWFTPHCEVNLCGHGTLAAAHILWEQKLLKEGSTLKLLSRSGELFVTQSPAGLTLNFPLQPTAPIDPIPNLAQALGVTPIAMNKAYDDVLVEIESEEEVRNLQPNISSLVQVDCRGVIVTAKAATKDFDFVSRFFAPRVGVNEDPVTGSAHCKLAHYWSEKLGKRHLKAFQASQRGGVLDLEIKGQRVLITGKAVTVLKGTFPSLTI